MRCFRTPSGRGVSFLVEGVVLVCDSIKNVMSTFAQVKIFELGMRTEGLIFSGKLKRFVYYRTVWLEIALHFEKLIITINLNVEGPIATRVEGIGIGVNSNLALNVESEVFGIEICFPKTFNMLSNRFKWHGRESCVDVRDERGNDFKAPMGNVVVQVRAFVCNERPISVVKHVESIEDGSTMECSATKSAMC